MKCLILAGGRGERLWPLSRTNFPKQFIKVQKNHSIFQETVARNMAYCDEFIIVTNAAYRPIIANQMEAFQGVSYRCVYEEEPRKTMAAIALGCRELQPSEFVFVVAADHLIDTGDCEGLSYKDAILLAKELARQGKIALFGKAATEIDSRFGYFTENAEYFVEKPKNGTKGTVPPVPFLENGPEGTVPPVPVYQNLGMMVFQSGTLFHELKKLRPEIYKQIMKAKGKPMPEGVLYPKEVLETIEPISIEHALIEPTSRRAGIAIGFSWDDIGSLEDLGKTNLLSEGTAVTRGSEGTEVINRAPDQAVVVNDVDNVLVVNTSDAVYIGRKGSSSFLKGIIRDNAALEPYMEQGRTVYRPWGWYEQLTAGENWSVRRVVILPGKTIYEHSHDKRGEHWTLLEGKARVTVGGKPAVFTKEVSVSVPPKTPHQISNIGETPLQMIETDLGEIRNVHDMRGNAGRDVTEKDLGMDIDALVRLSPAYKDYLWGGTKLRDLYHKPCDWDTIAESWELSAHPDGNSIVASGRHRGVPFGKYLKTIGPEALGWKCAPLQAFPLLIKFIDAKDNLSVQVHPGDDYALEHENEYGKNEMWYVIDAEPGAGLYVGFSRDTSKEEVRARIEDHTIEEILNFCPTRPGDIFFIPAGTVHAIGAGNLICEIQQSSNCTYRLWDYDRRDRYGNPRELHIDKALDVLTYTKYQPADLTIEETNAEEKQIRCKYFETAILSVNAASPRAIPVTDDSFRALVCIRGEGALSTDGETRPVKAGDSFFIPAANRTLSLSGNMTVALTGV